VTRLQSLLAEYLGCRTPPSRLPAAKRGRGAARGAQACLELSALFSLVAYTTQHVQPQPLLTRLPRAVSAALYCNSSPTSPPQCIRTHAPLRRPRCPALQANKQPCPPTSESCLESVARIRHRKDRLPPSYTHPWFAPVLSCRHSAWPVSKPHTQSAGALEESSWHITGHSVRRIRILLRYRLLGRCRSRLQNVSFSSKTR
jgi:hypothetical protein